MTRRPGDLIVKDPSSIEPQGIDWTAYLAELGAGVTITTSTYAVSPVGGITLSNAAITAGNLKTEVMLTGGTVGVRYTITNHIVTSNTVTDERSFDVLVEDR